jgi:hypothetical protein
MAVDPLVAGLRRIVLSGERLRTHLAGVSTDDNAASRGVGSVELAMFYGQAFGAVYSLLSDRSDPGSPAARALLEAEPGVVAFNLWMRTDTPMDAAEQLSQMDAHLEKGRSLGKTGLKLPTKH